MPKSKHRKGHKTQHKKYKANKKAQQESLKKKMMEQYIQMQKDNMANREAHTSTEEVAGPEIDIDSLNEIEDWEEINVDDVLDGEVEVKVDDIDVDVEVNVEDTKSE